ncbi:pyridoxamine 5'-phosphate oxidase family protein [Aeromicrobium duanguangcaii]|uniref:Pyridoxamine 5'-phosphate oxidase family protein n=1 Tax=Aeromicrobium duanguangcaii TaxID=2968086 RepID=A0ABY5KCZ3_9ACTN|nr:pyridoxamine 5'-phosphate oxidase family protein [Aeromicrobium duanguangcaii]MCD9154957.1 pyridoxamine 5'-phosphate oxidase family protein [Aeromicrobium duanguangcaii]MCL3839003.1 pyridoxamine 5'-phosphate oxidase family protein [Aeromicrobium duanguangcaii]UUI67638.1 pyridoxamine 5'-phosphate oxidase family protein [Aeromicrobium duanguangcaii]
MDIDSAITDMTGNEPWDFVADHTLGRLGMTILDQPEIFPVNYVLAGRQIVFRTAEGTKLMGVLLDRHVVFEVDEVNADGAASVILKGKARKIETQAELEKLDLDDLHSWVPTMKYNVVVIDVTEITGRRFRFGPEPELFPVM